MHERGHIAHWQVCAVLREMRDRGLLDDDAAIRDSLDRVEQRTLDNALEGVLDDDNAADRARPDAARDGTERDAEPPRCGRPRSNGRPCRCTVARPGDACLFHRDLQLSLFAVGLDVGEAER
jgi:plasmid stabilization system protein ParE